MGRFDGQAAVVTGAGSGLAPANADGVGGGNDAAVDRATYGTR
jgi:hypothetical protein